MNDFSKIAITGNIKLLSGLHIGGSSAFTAIGAIDYPIIKDSLTNLPIIPGSSLKGKMRTLLAKIYNKTVANDPSQDNEAILRLFGATNTNSDKKDAKKGIIRGKLLFRDALLINDDELLNKGAHSLTEVKFENTIDRFTVKAKPRQIERAMRGSIFKFELIYEHDDNDSLQQINDDFQVIINGMKLLEEDYLGGNGTRGYGKIAFENISVKTVFGNYDAQALDSQVKKAFDNDN